MSIVDKIVTEWAFRCKKGYPDLENPDDMKILKEIYSEFGIVMEAENRQQDDEIDFDSNEQPTDEPTTTNKPARIATPKTEYNDVIAKALGQVPGIEGEASKYKLQPTGTEIKITNSHDLEIFKKLYKEAPPKGNEQAGSAASKGSGHGEIALYWLLSQAGRNVQDSRGGGNADLLVDNIGVEVKSYSKGKDMVQLGRVGKYTTELLKLNTVFGINALLTTFSGTGRKKLPPNAIHATGPDVVEACKHVLAVYAMKEQMQQYGLTFFDSMFSKVDEVIAHAKNTENADELAATLLRDVLKAKFIDKPIGKDNAGGYMVNVTPSGDIDYTYVTLEAIDAIPTEKIINGVFINQGMINYSRSFFK